MGTWAPSHAQEHNDNPIFSSTVLPLPSTWGGSKHSRPGHNSYYTASVLEFPDSNWDQHLSMKKKLLISAWSHSRLFRCTLTIYLVLLLSSPGGAPRKRSWEAPGITCSHPPLIPRMRHSRYWHTCRFCQGWKSPILGAHTLKDWMHLGQHISNKLCNW